jgi:protein O-GlcNAc transferase
MGQSLAANLTADGTFQRALAALQAGNDQDAELLFKKVLGSQPKDLGALNLLALVLSRLGRFAEAENYFRLALAENTKSDATLYNYGIALKALHRPVEALERFTQALAINPAVAETWNNRGAVFNELKRPAEAIRDFETAIRLDPRYAEAFCNKGKSFTLLEQLEYALFAFDQALTIKPDFAEAWLGRGNVFWELRRYDDALLASEKALAFKPDLAEAWRGRGNILAEFKQLDRALAAYDRALELNPYLDYAASLRLYVKLQLCDWTNLEAESAQLLSMTRKRLALSGPFAMLALPTSAADQQESAVCYVQDRTAFPPLWGGEAYRHDRIHIAYLSADFHEHPVANLTATLFEHHDKSRFEVTGISFGPEQNSPMRQRIKDAFEHFIDVRDNSDREIADLVRRLEIDIAVDLMGHTQNARLGIFARRPAPIQASYLGYLGTMGAEFIDYVIADKIVLPFDRQKYYTENIVQLPDCFMVNDNRQAIATDTPSRQEAGLPSDGFVFCSFNASYKFGRPMFELWMRLLDAVGRSVLWLLESNPHMAVNLRREAQRCGIDSDRIVFAPRVPLAEHLARQRLAGLFLDSSPYNAGATAAAALWSGVPVLTVTGETFIGRMATSMLHAAGMPELVTKSSADYEALALKIAGEPLLCAALKDKLARNRGTCPLFDTARVTRHIEAAYTEMWQTYQRGRRPVGFAVG